MKIDKLTLSTLSDIPNILGSQLRILEKPDLLLVDWANQIAIDLELYKINFEESDSGVTNLSAFAGEVTGIKYVFLKDHVRQFKKIISYICLLIRSDFDNNQYIHLLPNLRALIEIFGNIRYVLSASTQDSLRYILTQQFYTFSTIMKMHSDIELDSIASEYERYYDQTKILRKLLNLELPRDHTKLDYIYVRDLKQPKVSKMLEEDGLVQYISETSKIFPTIHKKMYALYSDLSNYSHGNSMFANSIGREVYWVISHTIIFSSVLMEYLDNSILNGSEAKRLTSWRQLVVKQVPILTEQWKTVNTENKS